MRCKTIAIVVLLALSSCATREKRDAILLSKIKSRQPQWFMYTSDTIRKDELIDTTYIMLNTDSIKFDSLLEEYAQIKVAKDRLIGENTNLERLNESRQFLYLKERELVKKLRLGAFVASEHIKQGENYLFTVRVDPQKDKQVSITGYVVSKTINNKEVVTITKHVKPSTWQAVKKLWFVWAIILLLALIKIVLPKII